LSEAAILTFVVIIVIGAILFGIGTAIRTRERAASHGKTPIEPAAAPVSDAHLTWTSQFCENDEPLGAGARIELIERLGLVGAPWCADVLREAQRQERDPAVLHALERAFVNSLGPDSRS
jgi:hypothetical protein